MSIGSETVARTFASFVVGRFNAGTGSATSWVATDPLFEIGIGASSGSPENAMTVLKNGNVGIGEDNPGYNLHVNRVPPENRAADDMDSNYNGKAGYPTDKRYME